MMTMNQLIKEYKLEHKHIEVQVIDQRVYLGKKLISFKEAEELFNKGMLKITKTGKIVVELL